MGLSRKDRIRTEQAANLNQSSQDGVDDIEDIEVIIRDTNINDAPQVEIREIKSYSKKKPLKKPVGQTKIIAIINQKGGVWNQ